MLCSLPVVMLVWTVLATQTQAEFGQQGPKLVGTGGVPSVFSGGVYQGFSVSLSGDGNTAIVGEPEDNSKAGAAWVYTRSGGVWTQQGPKLVGAVAIGAALQGFSVSLSGDGNTAIVGGYNDSASSGAAWVYVQRPPPPPPPPPLCLHCSTAPQCCRCGGGVWIGGHCI